MTPHEPGDPPPKTLLVLGAAGDLTARLLLPGLGTLLARGECAGDLLLLGSGRDDWGDDRWRDLVERAFAAAGAGGDATAAVIDRTRYLPADATSASDLATLLEQADGAPAIYFALPPAVTHRSCVALRDIGVPNGTRLVMEKPFGSDVQSAQALNELVAAIVPDDHVHRVDHFLGMASVLNLIGVRFANRMLEPVLSGQHVAGVDIVFDETLALEGRAGYYDSAGALIDMLQSHLLQVLALVAMEPPATLEGHDMRDVKAQVLRATHVWGDDPAGSSYRARYTAGDIEGRRLASYADEDGVDPGRRTETLAAVELAVDTWRWAGVPFRLRSGKAIGNARQEVIVTFKDPPRLPDGLTGYRRSDRLRLGLGGHRLALDLNVNGEGDPHTLEPVTLEGVYGRSDLLEYGQVLRGVLGGASQLSVGGDAAVDSWRIVEPVLAAWRDDAVPLEEYAAGSPGPSGWPV
jgi:glucose-6-phosphate 1-dehydrogenase